MTGMTRAERTWLAAIFVALALALVWNQPRVPAPWVDEGQHVAAAATLARHGVYGAPNDGRIVVFDPAVQVGPPLIVPIAAAFAMAGVGELQARAVCAVGALLTAWMFWLAARRLVGVRRGLVALAVLVAGGGDAFASFAFLGRQVLGEVPAFGLLLVTFLLMHPRSGAMPAWRIAAAGGALGAALLTKGQLLFVAIPALGVVWLLDRTYYRQRPVYELPVVIAIALATLGAWQGAQRLALGPDAYAANVSVLRLGLYSQVLAGNPAFVRNALGVLWRTGLAWWGPLALAGIWWRVRHPTREGYMHAWLAAVSVASLAWFALLSVGWARYAAYAAMQLPLWATDAAAVATARVWPRVSRAVAWSCAAALLALIVGVQGRQWIPQVLSPIDTGFGPMRAAIARVVPDGARVETWEWEFLSDERVRYTHPDLALMYEVTVPIQAHRTEGRPVYDPLRARPRFVLQGPYGGWTGVYDRLLSGNGVRQVVRFGRYALYEIVDIDAARGRSE